MVILYGNHCPRCNILEKKLIAKGIEFEYFTDVDKMIEMGINDVPVLGVEHGDMSIRLQFSAAAQWINKQ